MIIFLIPFFYLTSRVASEKESKAKEGMKMMGLKDSTYYLAWFINYMFISMVTAGCTTVMAINVFTNVNMGIFFAFLMLYSINLWALSFAIVAILQTSRSSGIAAVLFQFISFYLSYIIADPSTPAAPQYAFSLFPNVCMN